ncbi:MAG TPA: MBL fold metallo-hydrolase [Anaeromyxobacteraceae bacterium]|nr:MBL fold metallo-hydrolase [Anaeromyxobacteraceae bacterium]
MRALLQLLARLALLAVALVAAGAIYFRVASGITHPPIAVEPGLVAEEGSGAWLYAVRTSAGVVLFDAGRDPRGRPIDRALRALDATRGEVTDVFLTHGHPEEAAGAAAVPAARVHAGAGDVAMAAGRELPGHGLERGLVLLMPRGGTVVSDPIPREQEIALAGGERVLAIPVPGHSPGSTAYLLGGVLFAGDAVSFGGGKLAPGPSFMSADPRQGERSIGALARRVAALPVRRICAGHGGCTPDGSAQRLLGELAAGR